MKDALSTFKPKSGLYLKFADGDEVKLRVLTLDPIVSEKTFEKGDEIVVSTKYAFVVWNWTDNKSQILEVGPGLLKRFVTLHKDEDTPTLNKMDIKITATGEQLKRRYEVMPLPQPKTLTASMVNEAKNIDLEATIQDHKGRLSEIESSDDDMAEESSGYEAAKAESKKLKDKQKVDEAMGEETETVDLGEEMPEDFLL